MSGSSTPLTGGSGALPFNNLKQPIYLQEVFGNMPKPANSSLYGSGPSYQDSNHDIFQGMQPGSHMFSDLVSSDNFIGNQYDGQTVLADRVSQQLLRDHVKLNPTLDLS